MFDALQRKSSSKDKVGEKQVDTFLEMPLAKSLSTKDSLPSKQGFSITFLKYNSALHPVQLLSAYLQRAKIC